MQFTTVEELSAWVRDPGNQAHSEYKNIHDELLLCNTFRSMLHNIKITVPDIFELGAIPPHILRGYVLELAVKQKKLSPHYRLNKPLPANILIHTLWNSVPQFYEEANGDILTNGTNPDYPFTEVFFSILTTKKVCVHDQEVLHQISLSLLHASTLQSKRDGPSDQSKK